MDKDERDNERSISALRGGLDRSWDLFLYGDKKSNTKPGNIQVYGTIAGQREVLRERLKKREELAELSGQKE